MIIEVSQNELRNIILGLCLGYNYFDEQKDDFDLLSERLLSQLLEESK